MLITAADGDAVAFILWVTTTIMMMLMMVIVMVMRTKHDQRKQYLNLTSRNRKSTQMPKHFSAAPGQFRQLDFEEPASHARVRTHERLRTPGTID